MKFGVFVQLILSFLTCAALAEEPSLNLQMKTPSAQNGTLQVPQNVDWGKVNTQLKGDVLGIKKGVNHGGGGDAVLADVIAVKDYIKSNGHAWPELKTARINFASLKATIQKIEASGSIEVVDTLDFGQNKNVAMVASPQSLSLKINRHFWLSHEARLDSKLAALVHGILWVQGLEGFNKSKFSNEFSWALGFIGKDKKNLIFRPVTVPNLPIESGLLERPDEIRADILLVRKFILENSKNWNALRNHRVAFQALNAKIMEVGIDDGLKLERFVSLADGKNRSAINRPWVPDIIVSTEFWKGSGSDTIRKVGLLLHEYLGLMGIEGTDDFTVSSAVMSELRVLVNTRIELSSPRLLPPSTIPRLECPNISGLWKRGGEALLIEQVDCESISQTMGKVVVKNGKEIIYRHTGKATSRYFVKNFVLDDGGWNPGGDTYEAETAIKKLWFEGDRVKTYHQMNMHGKIAMQVDEASRLINSNTLEIAHRTAIPGLKIGWGKLKIDKYERVR